MPEQFTITDALNRLAASFLEEGDSAGLVTAAGMGALPGTNADLTVFIDAGAPPCEEDGIRERATGLAAPFISTILRSGPFEGLAVRLDAAIAPLDIFQDNIPPVSAGTLGATVASGKKWYMLSSNHVLANNGQTPTGTSVRKPGPINAIGGGSRIGAFTGCLPLTAGRNHADCAWAELASPPAPPPTQQQEVTAVQASIGMKVSKTGRTTDQTFSIVQFPQWCGLIDFNFGTYYFTGQFATWDAAGANPPFAEPGDSGACVTRDGDPTRGVGLVCARGYAYDRGGEFLGYVIVSCPLDQVISGMKNNGLAAPTIYAV